MAPSCPIRIFEFHIAPTLAGDFSLIPIEIQTPSDLASRLSEAISGPSAATDWSATMESAVQSAAKAVDLLLA